MQCLIAFGNVVKRDSAQFGHRIGLVFATMAAAQTIFCRSLLAAEFSHRLLAILNRPTESRLPALLRRKQKTV
jgi:hypothetical protein